MKSFIKVGLYHLYMGGLKRGSLALVCMTVLVILMSSSSFVLADESNLTDQQKADMCINSSILLMKELNSSGFSILRINDTLKEAINIFDIQLSLAEKGRSTDYSRVLDICEQLVQLKNLAFELTDRIGVLRDFYNESSEGIDTTGIDALLLEIDKEMVNERYELIPELIEKTYSEIIIAQSRAATLNVFYDATTRSLKRFLSERWKEILIGLVILIILFIFLKKPVQIAMLKSDLKNVQVRRQSLKDMITKNQDLYFNQGKMSEDSFTIKNKKLAELIRDVDRQISLLNEQIYALDNRKKVSNSPLKKQEAVEPVRVVKTEAVSKKKSKPIKTLKTNSISKKKGKDFKNRKVIKLKKVVKSIKKK